MGRGREGRSGKRRERKGRGVVNPIQAGRWRIHVDKEARVSLQVHRTLASSPDARKPRTMFTVNSHHPHTVRTAKSLWKTKSQFPFTNNETRQKQGTNQAFPIPTRAKTSQSSTK